jgi:hypothetical protein
MPEPLLIAKSSDDSLTDIALLPKLANRRGLIAGATGTGKTVSLQMLTEQFSRIGAPVFMADVKGDLSGISRPAKPNIRVDERAKQPKLTVNPTGCPATLWDVFGEQGHPDIVEHAYICPPNSLIGPISLDERRQLIATSIAAGQYENIIDRESAFEKLRGRRGDANSAMPSQQPGSLGGAVGSIFGKIGDILRVSGGGRESIAESAMKSATRDGLGSLTARHPRRTGIDSGWTKVATTYLQ